MCAWVGPHGPSLGRQLWGLPSLVEYLSPQGTTASPLWLELRGLSAWQATPSWTVYRLTCQRSLPWLRVTFAMVPDAAWPGSDQRPWGTAPAAGLLGRLGRPRAPNPWGVGSFLSLGRPTCACVCRVLGHLAPVHRCARSVRCFACAVSWATWLLFTGVPARCVVLLMRCPGALGSCSPVCPLRALLCLWGVLGGMALVHRCARSVCCFACAVSWATWLLFTGVPARCVVLLVRCPEPLGSCSPLCPLGPLLCVCGVVGHLAPVHWCARSVCCFACAVSWVTWLLFTGVPARCVACVCGVLGHLAPVHWFVRSVRCVACAVSWATWLLFTGVPARCVACVCGLLGHLAPVHRCARSVCCLCVRCPGPLGYSTPVCPLGVLRCACGVLGHLAPVHRCARSMCCVACAVSWATWHLFTGVPARCVALRVRCPGPLGSCSPVCPLGVLPVCAVSLATWLPFTGVPARCVALLVRFPGPLGSCSPVCPLGPLLCISGVLGHWAPVHRCARSVCCFACAVSWATWLLFTSVPARCIALRVRCPGALGSCSPVCPLGVLPVCAVSSATWLLFTGVPARCVVLLVRCPGPLGSCSLVCPLSPLLCVCGVLGHLAPVHRCARSVCCFACAVSWATWLLFTGVRPRCVVLRVRYPGPLGICSRVCLLGVLCCVCAVLGPLALVLRSARPVCCAVSWVSWLLFTGVLARCVVLWVACAGRRCGALTRQSGRWLVVAGRGWVPSGRALVRTDGGCS